MLLTLLFFFTFVSHHGSATWINDSVLDIDGVALRVGARYSILPVIRGSGGGVTLGAGRNNSCFTGVVQDRFEVSGGTPVVFSPVNKLQSVVRISTDMNIKFSPSYRRDAGQCSLSRTWKLGEFDEETKQYFVTIGGEEGRVGAGGVANWFKIERNGNDYNLLFCPTVCDVCRVMCRQVGIYIDKGVRRLALSDVPFRVMFKKM